MTTTLEGFVVSGPVCALVEDWPQRNSDPRGDLGLFRVPPSGGKDQSDPRKRGTPNEGVRNEANFPIRTEMGRAKAPAEASLGLIVSNEPNLLRATGADVDGRGRRRSGRWARLYKRSQLAGTDKDRHGPEKALVEPSLGPIAPNEPNLPPPAGERHWRPKPRTLPPPGTDAPNKANSRQSEDASKYLAGKEL